MAVMQKNRALLLAKIETAVGTDPTPDAGLNAILCETPELTIVQTNLQRKFGLSYMGTVPKFNVGQGLKLKVKCEFKGSGVVSVAPEIGPLLRACNMTQAAGGGAVTYTPNSNIDSGEAVTLYFYQHNNLHKMSGCRGTHTVENKAGEYSVIEFEMTGVYQSVVGSNLTSVAASASYNSTIPPRFLAAAFSFNSVLSVVIETLKWNLGNKVVQRKDANAATGIKEWMITNREPTADIDPEAASLADFNPFSLWENSTRVTMGCQIGVTAGNKIIVTSAKVGIKDVKYGEREQILTTPLTLDLTPNVGNDELIYSFQ
jgi:hypothetical protein